MEHRITKIEETLNVLKSQNKEIYSHIVGDGLNKGNGLTDRISRLEGRLEQIERQQDQEIDAINTKIQKQVRFQTQVITAAGVIIVILKVFWKL